MTLAHQIPLHAGGLLHKNGQDSSVSLAAFGMSIVFVHVLSKKQSPGYLLSNFVQRSLYGADSVSFLKLQTAAFRRNLPIAGWGRQQRL